MGDTRLILAILRLVARRLLGIEGEGEDKATRKQKYLLVMPRAVPAPMPSVKDGMVADCLQRLTFRLGPSVPQKDVIERAIKHTYDAEKGEWTKHDGILSYAPIL